MPADNCANGTASMNVPLTLCMIYNDTHILLGKKKRGFGAGYWNGFGGKVEKGETVEQAARREVIEEIGIIPGALTKRGILHFDIAKDELHFAVHVFSASVLQGEPKESEEMQPQWFAYQEIPFKEMWADDKYWFPYLLSGKNFIGTFHFSDQKTLLAYDIHEGKV